MEKQRSGKKGYGFSFGLACIMHSVLIIFLLFSINMESKGSAAAKIQKVDIVQAAVIDEQAVQKEVKRLEKIELDQRAAAEKKEQMMAQKLEEAKVARLQEQAKLLQLKKEMQKAQREEESRLAEIKIAKEKERKELESLKQQKEKALVVAQQEKEQEKTAAAQAAAKAKAAETAAANAKKLKWLASEEEKNWALFKEKVNQSWIRAPGLPTGLRCKLDIQLLPDGSVMAVQVLNSSGNLAFDQSALAAVEKSAPLPVPQDPALIEKFRHFTFEFNPDEPQTGVIFN